jgi:hypothetical protein
LRISLLAAALLAALLWILRLLARRLIRVLAGLSGPIALSVLLTILVGIILFVIPSPYGREHVTTEHTVVRSGKSKRKPFNSNVADYLLIIATLAFSYPPRADRHIQHMHMRFYRYAPGARFNASDFLSAGFLLC